MMPAKKKSIMLMLLWTFLCVLFKFIIAARSTSSSIIIVNEMYTDIS